MSDALLSLAGFVQNTVLCNVYKNVLQPHTQTLSGGRINEASDIINVFIKVFPSRRLKLQELASTRVMK